MKTDIIIPTNRNVDFLKEWNQTFDLDDAHLIIVEDNKTKTIKVPKGFDYTHYCWEDIDKDLKKKAWIIPRHSDAIRSYGFLKSESDIIATLDDDCYPHSCNWLDLHKQNLNMKVMLYDFINVFDVSDIQPRGFPYGIRKRDKDVVFNLGLWDGIPDLDAATEIANPDFKPGFRYGIAKKGLMPICGMNVAFKRKVLPAYYQLTDDYPRFNDIWSGFILKKIMDHLGDALSMGLPVVKHQRKSNVFDNLIKEAPGLKFNEEFWKIINDCNDLSDTYKNCYLDFSYYFEKMDNPYLKKLSKAMKIWVSLVDR